MTTLEMLKIPFLGGKPNWVTTKISSNIKDPITHENQIFDLGYLGSMYHILTTLTCHQFYEKIVLKDIFNILF